MNELVPKEACPECGQEIPAGEPCPGCSLRLALSPDTPAPPGVSRTPPRGLKSAYFGDYEIIEEIARGGMGVVYRARQLGLNRIVALKMVQSHFSLSDEARLRFRVEIEAVAQLNHPNIVTLYESGEHDDVHYFTMRLVEGGDLAADFNLCRPLRARIQLLVKICRAVQYAHQRGILHRDLKPSNILVDERGEPHVADFGLAKSIDQETGFTFTSTVLGSPNYMSPEQASGTARQLTTSVDIYGLGAILYHLLTGRPPFHAGTPIETLRQVIDQEPLAPSKSDPHMDRDLETIALKCLRKEPAGRYATAEELASDLERWLSGRPILARPLGPIATAWRWSRRHPTLATLGVFSVAAILAFTIGSNLAAHRLKLARDQSNQLVAQLQHEKAESLLESGETSDGLALLAHLLNQRPGDTSAGLRLMSALTQRTFAVPWVKPWVSGAEVMAAGFASNDQHSFAVARNGRFRFTDLQTQAVTDGILEIENEPLLAATIHPDGTLLATIDSNGRLRFWRIARQPIPSLMLSNTTSTRQVIFDPRAQRAISVDQQQREVRRWEPALTANGSETWESTTIPIFSNEKVVNCVFNSTGDQWAVSGESGRVELWSTTAPHRERICTLPGRVAVMEFDAAGRRLAMASDIGKVFVWSLDQPGNVLAEFDYSSGVTDLEFSPDGQHLALAGWSHRGEAFVWNLKSGQRVGDNLVHRSHLTTVRFSPDGKLLITLGHDSTARCWNTETWRAVCEPPFHQSAVLQVAFSRDSRRFLTASYSGAVWWEILPPVGRPQVVSHDINVTQGAFSRDGTQFATATVKGRVAIHNLSNVVMQQEYQPHHGYVHFLEFSPSGSRLLSGDTEGRIHIRDVAMQTSAGIIPHPAPVLGAEFSPDEKTVLTAGRDGLTRVWRLSDYRLVFPALTHGSSLLGARYSPDNEWIATSGEDNRVRLWNARDGQGLPRPLQHSAAAEHIQFSPDSKHLFAGGRDLRPTLWEVATGREIECPSIHQKSMSCAAFSRDGKFLATASWDGVIEIAQLKDLGIAATTIKSSTPASSVEFAPDNRWLFSVTLRGEVRLWDLATGLPVSDPMRMKPSCSSARLSPDGTIVLAYGDNVNIGLWPLPRYHSSQAEKLIGLTEYIGRKRVSPTGQFTMSPAVSQSPNTIGFDFGLPFSRK